MYVVSCIVHDNISLKSNINLSSPAYEQWCTITWMTEHSEGGRVWRIWLLAWDGFLEGKVNYGPQSTWLKYQGRHTMIASVSVLCQGAIFHHFVYILEVKPIWASFINPKVLPLAGVGLSALWGWEQSRGRPWVDTMCCCLCVQRWVDVNVFVGICMCVHVQVILHSSIHLIE